MANITSTDMIPITYITDAQRLYQININQELREHLVKQAEYLNKIALGVNRKESGTHNPIPYITGASYFSLTESPSDARSVITKTIDFGALPNATTKNVAHGLTLDSTTMLVRFNGCATNTAGTSMLPLPFSSPTLNENIRVEITGSNISITTAIDYSDYIMCYIDLYYISRT